MITPDTPLLSPSRCAEATALRYLLTRGSWYDEVSRRAIVAAYWRVATHVGLDPLLALAQCIHETSAQQANKEWWPLSSWWAQRPRRNPAGIGVTGIPRVGLSFPSWADDAIPAHVGRLLAYVLSETGGTAAQRALIDRALTLRSLPASFRGSAPTLVGLNGRWATGQGYAVAIAAIANQIVRVS